jgi:hypothetical protein
MDYGHAIFSSAIACVLAAVVVCTLVLRYGFTRDSDPAGRWGWQPTRIGHGIAAALFGTGVALAILALTAAPLDGKGHPPGFGDTLRARLEVLRGRLGALENVVARWSEDPLGRMRKTSPSPVEQARAPRAGGEAAVAATAATPRDVPRASSVGDGARAAVGVIPAAPLAQPQASVKPQPAMARSERRSNRPEKPVVAVEPTPGETGMAAAASPPIIDPPRVVDPPRGSSQPGKPSDVGKPADGDAPSDFDRRADAGKPDKQRGNVEAKADTAVIDAPPRVSQPDRGDRARTDTTDRPPKIDRPDRTERADKIERADRVDRPARVERAERIERPQRVERPERIERVDRPERIEKIDKVEKVEKIEKVDRVERGGKR